MTLFKKYTAILLLVVFGYILTPAELIHELHGHQDTKCVPGSATIDNRHIHCKILQVEGQVFTSPALISLSFTNEFPAPGNHPIHAVPSRAFMLFASLRAPPVV